MNGVRTALIGSTLLVVGCAVPTGEAESVTSRKNILFLCVDDLRPELGCYGAAHMQTPNLDALASRGVVFNHHYVQVPTCGASRASMLTGRYPRTRRSLGNAAFATLPREGHDHLPGWFKAHGYRTVSIGKVTHTPDGRRRDRGGKGDGAPQLANAWHECGAPTGRWGDAWSAFFGYDNGRGRTKGKSPAFEVSQGGIDDNPDGLIATAAIDELRRMGKAANATPFFLAVGFYRPHLPHNAPRRWFDLYPTRSLPLPETLVPPAAVDSRLTLHRSGELLHNYGRHPRGGLKNDAYLRQLRAAYFASVSHVDRQIGRVLDELRRGGLADDTIVVVWGDHGYHLGDLGLWGKHTLHERALRSALIVAVPGPGKTGVCSTCVQSVDLFPTLAELCGLPAPSRVDGQSLVPLLADPARREQRIARSFWRRGKAIGTSLRAAGWRFTQWRRGEQVVETEFYDHSADTGLRVVEETHNAAHKGSEALERARAALGPPLIR